MRITTITVILGCLAVPGTLVAQAGAPTVSVVYDGACAMIAGRAECGPLGRGLFNGMTALPGDPGLVSIASGGSYGCGLTARGELYCIGENTRENGAPWTVESATVQCANGELRCSDHLIRVASSLTFAKLGVGFQTICGITPAGKLWCWGNNEFGQAGGLRRGGLTRPVAVAPSVNFAQVVVGEEHACALSVTGQAWCWGSNFVPYLGLGTIDSTDHGRAPAPVLGHHVFTSLTASTEFTCGLQADGSAWCWGTNPDHWIGDGSMHTCDVPGMPACFLMVPTAVVPAYRFASLSAGTGYACGMTTAGEAVCWGGNASGRLGGGQGYPQLRGSSLPLRVVGSPRMVAVAAGQFKTCGLGNDGRLYCWGKVDDWGPVVMLEADREVSHPVPAPAAEARDDAAALFARWRTVAPPPSAAKSHRGPPPSGLPHPG